MRKCFLTYTTISSFVYFHVFFFSFVHTFVWSLMKITRLMFYRKNKTTFHLNFSQSQNTKKKTTIVFCSIVCELLFLKTIFFFVENLLSFPRIFFTLTSHIIYIFVGAYHPSLMWWIYHDSLKLFDNVIKEFRSIEDNLLLLNSFNYWRLIISRRNLKWRKKKLFLFRWYFAPGCCERKKSWIKYYK